MTAQSWNTINKKNLELKNPGNRNELGTESYRISGRGTEQHRFCGVHLVSSDPLLRHLPLHQFLVRPEIDTVSASFTAECRDLALVNSGDPVSGIDLLASIPWTSIQPCFIGLSLQTCGERVRRIARRIISDKMYSRIRMCSTGPDTTEFARPAMTPEAKYCDPVRDPSPIPEETFREENTRFEYSSPANWIETHTPIPSNGVNVPYVPDII